MSERHARDSRHDVNRVDISGRDYAGIRVDGVKEVHTRYMQRKEVLSWE